MATKPTSKPKPAQAKASAAPAAAPEPAVPPATDPAPADQKAADEPPVEQPPADKPAEKAKPADTSKDLVVKVSTTAERGRWRIGRQFGRAVTEIPRAEITDEHLAALEADPVLSVTVEPANPDAAA